MSDQELHGLFKDSLEDFEPDYNPAHWSRMKDKLRAEGLTQAPTLADRLRNHWPTAAGMVAVFLAGIATGVFSDRLLSDCDCLPVSNRHVLNLPLAAAPDFIEIPIALPDTLVLLPANMATPVQQAAQKRPPVELSYISPWFMDQYGYLFENASFVDVPFYNVTEASPEARQVFMSFGSAEPVNPEVVSAISAHQIAEIVLVYTRNPSEDSRGELNAKRIQKLFEMVPGLEDRKDLKYTFIAQTAGGTPQEAASLFHGFIIYLKGDPSLGNSQLDFANAQLQFAIDSMKYAARLKAEADSLRLVEARTKARRSVVVFDWTASMFDYYPKASAWLFNNRYQSDIRAFVFFNDCDSAGIPVVESGRMGAMYHVPFKNYDEVLATMNVVGKKGLMNNDYPENDYDAILHAIQLHPDAQRLVLVADNKSAVRNRHLLRRISKPVDIVLFGVPEMADKIIQNDYFNLAHHTGGGIYLAENPTVDISKLKDGEEMLIEGRKYIYQAGRFRPAPNK